LALALGVELSRDPAMETILRERYRKYGFELSDRQARQADRPEGARTLPNPVGSAPGLAVEREDRILFVLPGVPEEMKALYETEVEPALRARRPAEAPAARVIKVAGRTESYVDERIGDLYDRPGVSVNVLASPAAVEILLQVEGGTERERAARLEEMDRMLSERLGRDLLGRDDETLASVVGRLLQARGRTLATAESCTAGLLSGELTRVPGSSAWFPGGVVVYSNESKVVLAGVDRGTLEAHGAVSAEVARELADGARRACGSDVGVAVTGIAGPGGGTEEKPVGTVHVAVSDADGWTGRRLRLTGDRDLVRRRSVTAALDLVRRRLEGWT
jgi:nicotinamide-nucleotide amidase